MKVLDALLDVAIRRPVRPPRAGRLPKRGFLRVLVLLFWAGLAIGFGAGSISLLIDNLHITPSAAAFIGIMQCAPLFFVWRTPLLAWRIMALGWLLGVLPLTGQEVAWPWPATSVLAMAAVLVQVGVCYERPTVLGVGLATGLVTAVPTVVLAGTPLWAGLIVVGIMVVALAFGDAAGGRYAAEASLAEQTELRQRDLARQAVLEERARIARELHDVVAHHMSVIALQAEAARFKIPDLPAAAEDTFATIRTAAKDALAETRRVVGLLREDSEEAERVPQPGLDRLAELVDAGTQAGLTMSSQVVGVPRPLSAGVDVSAYRIVQEALSNAARYAPASRVRVEIRYGAEALRVSVADDGAEGSSAEVGGGHGLVGMRERVSMLGGTLSAGPREEGGFAVVADLPYG